jgi:hypothetical protein
MFIADWRLQIADSRIAEWPLPISITDCRFGLPIADLDYRLPIWIGDCRFGLATADFG